MAKPAGVIFDFDGVVVDSLSVHLEAWKAAYISLFGVKLEDTTGLAGRSTSSIAQILSARADQPHRSAALADLKRQALRDSRSSIRPIPGALEAFAYLAANGMPFGIASNAPRAFITQTLSDLGTSVNHIFGIDDTPRPKPAPDLFLLCAKSIGVHFMNHARTIVFEDSVHGLNAAVTAGMYPIGVTTQNSASELTAAGANRTCTNIAEAQTNGWFCEI